MLHLDYCYTILYGLPDNHIQKLQIAQSAAARLVTKAKKKKKKNDHVSPISKHINWLPIKNQILFKVLSTLFLCLSDLAVPSYQRELLVQYRPSKNLRSESKSLFIAQGYVNT